MTIAPLNLDRNMASIVFIDGSLADLQAILNGLMHDDAITIHSAGV